MLELILPSCAEVASTRGDIEAALHPEEEASLGRAVEKRRREFVTARACARQALARLGLPPAPIPNGPRGEPLWPPGIVGSITHCLGYRACAVARAAELASIGVDTEPNEPLPDGLLGDIALPREREWIRERRQEPGAPSWDRLLFCIKESVYKAWFPLAGRWLGFEDAAVAIDPWRGSFEARLLVPGPLLAGRELKAFSGRWLARDGLLLAAIALAVPVSESRLGGEGAGDEE
jgi:4'-phosphopantetheinyl transferase EntD